MPSLVRPATREVRNRIFDSALWAPYEPREGDIIVATYPKCGTTWTQRIVAMLLSGSALPAPLEIPWYDMRLFPVEMTLHFASRPGRRQIKSHLPYDALPVYEGVKFIHMARDGRDSAMSLHNHMRGFTDFANAGATAISLADPKFGDALPPTAEDPAEFFHTWLQDGGAMGDEGAGFFHMENSYWAARHDPNMLLVHYADLKADRDGEMRRIARFLDIDVEEPAWSEIVEAAGFEAMKAQGETLMPTAAMTWEGGSQRFLYKGTNGRWQDVVSKADLAAYDALVQQRCSPGLAAWLEHGRRGAGDPAATPG